MKADLAGANPTRLHRMLVDQVASCWLALKHLEGNVALAEPRFRQQSAHQARLLDGAHKRYLSAVQALTNHAKLLPTSEAPVAAKKIYEPERRTG